MADALDTLARLRRLEADQARRALGEAIAREAQARDRADDARAAQQREATFVGGAAVDGLAGAYAAWLPAAARAIAAAEAENIRCQADTESAKAALGASKAALEAVDILIAERDRLRRRKLARKTQILLDEMGRRSG